MQRDSLEVHLSCLWVSGVRPYLVLSVLLALDALQFDLASHCWRTSGLLWIKLLWASVYTGFCVNLFSFLWDKRPGVQFLGGRSVTGSVRWEAAAPFPSGCSIRLPASSVWGTRSLSCVTSAWRCHCVVFSRFDWCFCVEFQTKGFGFLIPFIFPMLGHIMNYFNKSEFIFLWVPLDSKASI